MIVQRLRKELGGYLYLATAKLAEQYDAGCLGLRIGKDRAVVCLDFDIIKEMLNNEDFDGRPQGPFYETRTWGVRRGNLLSISKCSWKKDEKFYSVVQNHLIILGSM